MNYLASLLLLATFSSVAVTSSAFSDYTSHVLTGLDAESLDASDSQAETRQRLRQDLMEGLSYRRNLMQDAATNQGAPSLRGTIPGFSRINNLARISSRNMTLQSVPSSRQPGCKRLMWFTAVSARFDGRIRPQYATFMVAALLSALRNSPSLIPNLIYDGPPGLPIVDWWAAMGGIVHHHNLTFYENLKAVSKPPYHPPLFIGLSGAFLRFDIPLIMANYTVPDDVDPDYVLYTDVDSMFLKDIDSCSFPPTPVFSMGPEFEKGEIVNAGVMHINLKGFNKHRQGFLDFAEARQWPMVQPILLGYFKDRTDDQMTHLADHFNWKGYWGRSDNATIIHFHGPKPGLCVECYLLNYHNKRYCTQKYHECDVYLAVWKMSPDDGEFYIDILEQFYFYIGLVTATFL